MARETAWYSWEEWHNVKDLLYCFDSAKNQNEGLQMVEMWKCRMRSGTLPVSVELTSTLVTAHLLSLDCSKDTKSQCQLGSAMALVRFVNGVTDQLQAGVYVESVQTIADRIHIPEWIVDLRHSATHSQLPSQEVLHSGIIFALNWLYQSYWEETSVKIVKMERSFETNISEYLSEYVNLTFDVLCEGMFNKEEKDGKLEKGRRNTQSKSLSRCRDISQIILRVINPGNIQNALRVCVRKGFIIPSEEQIKVLNFPTKLETLKNDELAVLNKLVEFWRPLIDVIQNKFPVSVELMVKEIIQFCCRNSQEHNMSSGLISLFLISMLIPSSHPYMIQFLVRHPSPFSFQILNYMAKQSSPVTRNPDFMEKLQKLLTVFEECIPVLVKPLNIDLDLKKELDGNPSMEKYLTVIESFQNVQQTSDVKPNISKWKLVSSAYLENLPPMGEYSGPIGCLRLPKFLNSQYAMSNLNTQELLNDTNATNYTSEELTAIIDSLFLDRSIVIGDDDSDNESSLTEEYCFENDRPWDENCVDFEIKSEEKPKRMVNINDIDVTRIMFL